jgi:hypothetical protein
MSFKDYYNSLTIDGKNAIKNQITPKYMGNSTFYDKLAGNSWTKLEFEKLETITNQIFER